MPRKTWPLPLGKYMGEILGADISSEPRRGHRWSQEEHQKFLPRSLLGPFRHLENCSDTVTRPPKTGWGGLHPSHRSGLGRSIRPLLEFGDATCGSDRKMWQGPALMPNFSEMNWSLDSRGWCGCWLWISSPKIRRTARQNTAQRVEQRDGAFHSARRPPSDPENAKDRLLLPLVPNSCVLLNDRSKQGR